MFNKEELKEPEVNITHGPDGLIVMCLKNQKGGPIISGNSIEEVKTKFEEAYNLCMAIKKFVDFSKLFE
jgi:hypothetical protein